MMKYNVMFTLFIVALIPGSMLGMESVSDDQIIARIDELTTDLDRINNVLQQATTIKANKRIKENPALITRTFTKWQVQNPNTTMADYYIFLNNQAAIADALPRYENLKRSFNKELSNLKQQLHKRRARPEKTLEYVPTKSGRM